MGDVSANFNYSEFQCRCGCPLPLHAKIAIRCLVKQLEVVRAAIGRPIIVNSGYRCEAHNYRVGGAIGSLHLAAMAADIRVNALTPRQLGDVIKSLRNSGRIASGGLSVYNSFVHYDIRGTNIDF